MRDLISIDSLMQGNDSVVRESKYNKKLAEEYGKDQYRLSQLSEVQLGELRQDICLGSYYINDYENRFGIDPKQVAMFFDGYEEYISEIMLENGIDCDAYFENLSKFDTTENLYKWHSIVYNGMWFSLEGSVS